MSPRDIDRRDFATSGGTPTGFAMLRRMAQWGFVTPSGGLLLLGVCDLITLWHTELSDELCAADCHFATSHGKPRRRANRLVFPAVTLTAWLCGLPRDLTPYGALALSNKCTERPAPFAVAASRVLAPLAPDSGSSIKYNATYHNIQRTAAAATTPTTITTSPVV